MASQEDARQAKRKVLDLLQTVAPSASVGLTKVSDDEWGLKINLQSPLPDHFAQPELVDGVPVRFEIVGRISPR